MSRRRKAIKPFSPSSSRNWRWESIDLLWVWATFAKSLIFLALLLMIKNQQKGIHKENTIIFEIHFIQHILFSKIMAFSIMHEQKNKMPQDSFSNYVHGHYFLCQVSILKIIEWDGLIWVLFSLFHKIPVVDTWKKCTYMLYIYVPCSILHIIELKFLIWFLTLLSLDTEICNFTHQDDATMFW